MSRSQKRALKISGIYLLFGFLWITISDRLLGTLVSDSATFGKISMYKGWFFILVTAILVFFLTRRALTKQERLTDEAQLNEERFRAIIETTDTGFVVLDEQGRVLDANSIYARMTGHASISDILDHSVTEWTAPHDIDRNRAEVVKCFQQGCVRNLTITYQHPDGTLVPVEINATTIKTKAGTVIVTLCRDITEQRRAEKHRAELEAQLLQSQKMEAVGQLAGGIAHDMNNILSIIMGHAFLLTTSMATDDSKKELVDQIIVTVQRATSLTRDLLAFSRKQVLAKQRVDLIEIISNIGTLLRRLIREDIELTIRTAGGPLYALVDRVQIEQVLMNLTTNARDSMQNGGQLTISIEPVDINEEHSLRYELAGKCACITVQDTGHGMDDATKARIFEPFFTTKEEGKGTGLGLAMVFGIVKQHVGAIEVDSEIGQGTAFRIYLPLLRQEDQTNECRPSP